MLLTYLIEASTTNVTNYIQVNNLRITKDEFDQLPNETIVQIEKLISENLKKVNFANGKT